MKMHGFPNFWRQGSPIVGLDSFAPCASTQQRFCNRTRPNGDAADQAEAPLGQSLEIARRQEAKLFELRAATSLAWLWLRQGKRAAACALLAPVYDWFTEGFDTRDLKDARALLDDLA